MLQSYLISTKLVKLPGGKFAYEDRDGSTGVQLIRFATSRFRRKVDRSLLNAILLSCMMSKGMMLRLQLQRSGTSSPSRITMIFPGPCSSPMDCSPRPLRNRSSLPGPLRVLKTKSAFPFLAPPDLPRPALRCTHLHAGACTPPHPVQRRAPHRALAPPRACRRGAPRRRRGG